MARSAVARLQCSALLKIWPWARRSLREGKIVGLLAREAYARFDVALDMPSEIVD